MGRDPGSVVTRSVRVALRWCSLLAALILLIAGLTSAPECAAQAMVDVTTQVRVTKSGLVYNRQTNTFNCVVTITNTSSSALNGPLFLIISGLRTNVTLANQSGQDPTENPYLSLAVPTGGLSPGQSISNVLLKFGNPSRVAFTFNLSIKQQTQAFATSDGSSVVFTGPAGNIVLSIPLQNQEVTGPGNITTVTHERGNISDDGTHAGVYTITFDVTAGNEGTEALVTGIFRYFNSAGQLWQIQAPPGTGFFLPIIKSVRLLTPDGSRVLMISTDEGNTDPVFSVYDQTGNVLYQSAGAFLGLSEADIAPNGRYLLAMGTVKTDTGYSDLIRVTDISTSLSSDFPFDIVKGGRPVITISSDGRFLISYQGGQAILP